MTKAEYKKLLQSPKWKAKRAKILERDNFKCTRCGETKYLQVHHVHYIQGRKPWQVPDFYLITVCRNCHKYYHEQNKISVLKLPPLKKKPQKPKPKKQKPIIEPKPPDLKGVPAHLRLKIIQAYIEQRNKMRKKQAIRDRNRNIRTTSSDSRAQIENA